MATLKHHTTHHMEPAIHDSTFFFVGPFDDNIFCRGPQCIKPIDTSFFKPTLSKHSSLAASPISERGDVFISDDEEDDDCAVLADDEAQSEDELPPSPRRRHSGAMSISEEDLPFCYDREALQRDTAAHRKRHQQQLQALAGAAHEGQHPPSTFAAHAQWDSEVDGPHMALWLPDSQRLAVDRKRRRVEKTPAAPAAPVAPKDNVLEHRHSSEMEGPMMALWGV